MLIKDRKEFSTKAKPLTFKPSDKVLSAVKIMTEKGFGSALVVDSKNKLKGIVTERDLMTRLLYNEMDPKKTKLSDIMTTEVRVAKEDDYTMDWLRVMSNERFRHLPIVNDEGEVVNIMSQGDFVAYTWPELMTLMKENAKASLGPGFQVIIMLAAFLLYAIIVLALT